MKHSLFLILILISTLTACKSAKETKNATKNIEGNWTLNYISGSRIAFKGLYPNNAPEIIFETNTNMVKGNSSCNSFGSKYTIDNHKIQFEPPFGTKKFCQGTGEQTFYNTLQKINRYSVVNDSLLFFVDDVVMMRFIKKK
ncbi:META domain-containing protein [Flavobacterium faecale]|uniref:META domain-containing protein n=1 Tax=Flavobacterium faecale TaxID=1355330 RepID=UPI003AACAC0D